MWVGLRKLQENVCLEGKMEGETAALKNSWKSEKTTKVEIKPGVDTENGVARSLKIVFCQ